MSDNNTSKGAASAAASGRKGPGKNGSGKGGPQKPPARERDQVDLFIEEVTEELQRERAYKLFRTYGPLVGAAVVLIVLAASVNEYLKSAATGAAREAGQTLIGAYDAPDRDARIAAFAKAAESQEGGPSLLARLHEGALQADAGRAEAAATTFDKAAAQAAASERPLYADLATLRAAMARFDSAPPQELIAALEPLTAEQKPLRAFALELLGLAQAKAGQLEAARTSLEASEAAWGARVEAQRRVRALIEGLGAENDASTSADGAEKAK